MINAINTFLKLNETLLFFLDIAVIPIAAIAVRDKSNSASPHILGRLNVSISSQINLRTTFKKVLQKERLLKKFYKTVLKFILRTILK